MIDFTKELDRFSNKSISFEINLKTNELEIDSEEYTTNGLSVDRHTFNLSKDEAKKIVEYLSAWVSAGIACNGGALRSGGHRYSSARKLTTAKLKN